MNSLAEIISGCKEGQSAALEVLFNLYSEKMFGVCLYYSSCHAEAEDILHDGFIRIFEKIGSYKNIGSFEAWMKRIFINIALMRFRRNKKFLDVEDIDEYTDNNYERNLNLYSNINEIICMISKLPSQYRMVFNLYAIEGYKHKEIAKMLKISVGTSKSNLSRARTILQDQLKELE